MHFRALAQELVHRGHQVVVLVDGQRRDVARHNDNPLVYTWPSRRPNSMRDLLFLLRFIRKHRPTCFVANFGASNLMMCAGWLMRVPVRIDWYHTLSTQVGLDWRVSSLKLRCLRLRKRMIYKAATNVVANSEATRSDLRRVFRVPAEKCNVFFNSLADPFRDLCLPKNEHGRKVITCVGRLNQSKGQDVLIRAMNKVKDKYPDVLVEFVGTGDLENSLVRLAAELGVDSICSFIGSVAHDEVLRRMASAIVTIVPSRDEAFGLVAIESLAVGTPVIGSRVGGIAEIVRDTIDGFLVPPDDPALLAQKIGMMLSDVELARTMGTNARRRFLEHFEQQAIVAQQAVWLEDLLNQRQAPKRRTLSM
jgi:glycosyltransferase involved in cell wall biosynthesis